MTSTANSVFENNSSISDDDVELARTRIGEVLRVPEPFNRYVTVDGIRHFSYGCGDDNPLFCSESYAQARGLGSVVAPPTYLYSVFPAGIGPNFSGLQGFHGGSKWTFYRPLKPGDEISASATLLDIQDVQGRRSGRMLVEIGLAEYRDAAGDLIATNVSRTLRKPRVGFGDAMSTEPRPAFQLSTAELSELEETIVAYTRRGSEPRYWEDVSPGDKLEMRLKPPLSLYDIIGFAGGIGLVLGGEVALRKRYMAARSPETAPNTRPIGWLTERIPPGQGHMDPSVAQAVGVPAIYDVGWHRISAIASYITDWIGDAGELQDLDSYIRLPNMGGDVLSLAGVVRSKSITDEGDHLAAIDIVASRQDGAQSCASVAVVKLPTKDGAK